MSRKNRYNEPGVIYHLISRFVDHEWFMRNAKDREHYLRLLAGSLSESDWKCLAYAIMSNHLHLAMVAGEQPLGSWIRRVHGPFAEFVNLERNRIGAVFVRGPVDHVTPTNRVGELIAYIHNNPVRANVVERPGQSNWTSHRAYIGLEPAPAWLHTKEGLAMSGFEDPGRFDQWVGTSPRDPSRAAIERTRKVPACEEREWRAIATRVVPRIDAPVVVETVASEVGLSVAALRLNRRYPSHVLARKIAVRCADSLGIKGVDIANALGISQQRASAVLRDRTESGEVAALATRVMSRMAYSK